ncbi:hypothetical protein BASA81_015184 [Batrachochytrium salamandrivorans]|nr:hypothetical protein BASA81_015184 [Batrachochytrium salamandrivorans]
MWLLLFLLGAGLGFSNQVTLPWAWQDKSMILLNHRYVLDVQLYNGRAMLELDAKGQPSSSIRDRYSLDNRLGRGSSGEVWLARDVLNDSRMYVLKRIFPPKHESGKRERYFGKVLQGELGFTRYVEAFYRTSQVTREAELWLVFEYEGVSLHTFLYDTDPKTGAVVRSKFWKRLRETLGFGAQLRREIAKQLVMALHNLTLHGIVHRDLKPANVLIQAEAHAVKLGDFGSAVDFHSQPPFSRQDHSLQYEPPEFQLGEGGGDEPLECSRFHPSFDAWSLGVLLLEMLLGTDRVFELSPAQTRTLARHHRAVHSSNHAVLDALREFGLDDLNKFNASVVRLDEMYHRGFYDDAANRQASHNELEFVFQLLQVDPRRRITMADALKHPYLSSKRSPRQGDGNGDGDGHTALLAAESFVCGSCHRVFSNYEGCHAHSTARKHDHSSLPACLAQITHTPSRQQLCESGTVLHFPLGAQYWCGSRGRKSYSEDFFHCSQDARVFAVADGHLGQAAARFATQQLVKRAASTSNLSQLFATVNQDLLSEFPHDRSGAAVTLAVFSPDRTTLTVANVGDVRAILCCGPGFLPVVLTVDHLASLERHRVTQLPGGQVSFKNGRDRIQGVLALSRSFGDRDFRPFVITEPHVVTVNLTSARFRFLVLASDGLIDAMSDLDICKLCRSELDQAESLQPVGAFPMSPTTTAQEEGAEEEEWYTRAATKLVLQARLRDQTSDNVGVAVIPL